MTAPRIQAQPGDEQDDDRSVPVVVATVTQGSRWRRWLVMGALFTGAVVFLFPFYYMIVASLQRSPNTSVGGAFPSLGNLTLDNYAQINASLNLWQSLLNSGIFTGGVLLGTLVSVCWADTPWPCCISGAAACCSPRCCWCSWCRSSCR